MSRVMTWIATMRLVLAELCEPLRYFKHRRERIAAEKQAEREHMLEILDTLLERVEKLVEHQKDAGVAQAAAVSRMAEAFGTWLEMFQQSAQDQAHLGSVTVRAEDEYEAELERERERLIKKGFPINRPETEQLQWLLDNDD
jgi:DNA-binding protein H-NS